MILEILRNDIKYRILKEECDISVKKAQIFCLEECAPTKNKKDSIIKLNEEIRMHETILELHKKQLDMLISVM